MKDGKAAYTIRWFFCCVYLNIWEAWTGVARIREERVVSDKKEGHGDDMARLKG